MAKTIVTLESRKAEFQKKLDPLYPGIGDVDAEKMAKARKFLKKTIAELDCKGDKKAVAEKKLLMECLGEVVMRAAKDVTADRREQGAAASFYFGGAKADGPREERKLAVSCLGSLMKAEVKKPHAEVNPESIGRAADMLRLFGDAHAVAALREAGKGLEIAAAKLAEFSHMLETPHSPNELRFAAKHVEEIARGLEAAENAKPSADELKNNALK